MELTNGQNRSPQLPEQSQNGQLETGIGGLGFIPGNSPAIGFNTIAVGGEDCYQSNTAITGHQPNDGVFGKVVGQLIDENEKQLAYHQHQAEVIKNRIEELKRIPEKLTE